jgi:hypothetical protein
MQDHNGSLISLGEFGERARPLEVPLGEAALVIGLGQVGLQAVVRLRAMLCDLLPPRELQGNVRLLAIARHRSLREEAALPREERLTLHMDQLPWSDIPGRYAQLGVAQWWPHSPRAQEAREDPALVRAFSRLLLFHNASLVSEALFKRMQWLAEAGTGRQLQLTRRVYVLAALAEAEGSGMVFDIVSRLRALSGQKRVAINGFFSLRGPENPDDPDDVLAMANVYAALREIDAFTLHPETYPSTLPVIGHSLPERKTPRRALDGIFLLDDAAAETVEPPENLLAEAVTTWVASSLAGQEQAVTMPEAADLATDHDRFGGYSTLGISKLALPTRAAMDLAAVGMAHVALRAMKSTQADTPTSQWVSQIMDAARQAVFDPSLSKESKVADHLREWSYDMSAAGLIRKQERHSGPGDPPGIVALVQDERRRLEREGVGEDALGTGMVNAIPDSLRSRLDAALQANLREVHRTLLDSPLDLAYGKGLGLVWTASALEELERQVKRAFPEIQQQLTEAQAATQLHWRKLLAAAQQYDTKSGARFGGSRKALAAELDTCAEGALHAMVDLFAIQARQAAWQHLQRMVDDLREQVREVIPQVAQTSEQLREFEAAHRKGMENAVQQPPQFPTGVVLTEQWYVNGARDIATVGQVQPRAILRRVYRMWTPPDDVLPERRLARFLADIQDAARRVLKGSFKFADLYEFLSEHDDIPMFKQAAARLPEAATPPLIPSPGDNAPAPYELVREVKRPFSALGPPQGGVNRLVIPSPDPDEITVLRVLHGLVAEAIPALREGYRRAYDRAGAEGMPLHIDRRWDSTMADLVHTSARREISLIWERLVDGIHSGPRAVQQPLNALVKALGVALDVQDTATAPDLPADLRLVVFRLPPFRLKLPPPNCAVLFIYSNRTAEEISEDIYKALTPLPLEEQFAFVVNLNRRPDIEQIVEPLRRVDFTILVLEEADVKHLISARLPTRALRDLVLDQVSLTTVSPFYTRGPVPEHMFFGREREINEVRSKLRTHSVALIGGRRIGKTSTLQRIQRLLKPPDSDYVPYYLDCHGATQYRSFFWLINRRWEVDIPQTAYPVQFEDVVTALQARHPGKNIVILFDEVDSLLEFDRQTDNQETLFRTFRSLSNEKRCQYVFSGEKWLMRAIANPYSALFNFAQAVRLEPLPPKVVHHLVADPFEMLNVWMEQSEQVIDRIYQISAGHPNIVQMICQAMVEKLDEDPANANLLSFEHLDKATARRTLQEEIVQTIWGQMNPLAQMITLIWPEGTRMLALREIEHKLAGVGIEQVPPERLERTAKDLELYCFVRPRDNDRLELIPMAFPAILDFMTDKARQVEIVRRRYEANPDGLL